MQKQPQNLVLIWFYLWPYDPGAIRKLRRNKPRKENWTNISKSSIIGFWVCITIQNSL